MPLKDLNEERDRQKREFGANGAIEANNREIMRRREQMERELQRQLERDRQELQNRQRK